MKNNISNDSFGRVLIIEKEPIIFITTNQMSISQEGIEIVKSWNDQEIKPHLLDKDDSREFNRSVKEMLSISMKDALANAEKDENGDGSMQLIRVCAATIASLGSGNYVYDYRQPDCTPSKKTNIAYKKLIRHLKKQGRGQVTAG